jgi:subtilisin family serine protease
MSSPYSNNNTTLHNFTTYTDIGWHLDQINITGAWNITFGSSNITIAVIDSGIDFSHPELFQQWKNTDELPADGIDNDLNGYIDDDHGWDFVSNDSEPGPQAVDPIHWHATYITGIISAPLNDYGIAGVAPNVTIMDLRVLDQANYQGTTDEELGDAIKYAVDNGADVINLSLQYYVNSSLYLDDILYAISKNVTVVSVTGNNWAGGLEIPSYPGAFSEVIAVGATNYFYQKADYSNYGLPWTELMAPVGDGEDFVPSQTINSTFPPPYLPYGNAYGTSFAAPQVAGVIALMKSINKTMTVNEIRTILQNTAIDLGAPGIDIYFGYGLINASAAVIETYNRYGVPTIAEFRPLQNSILLILIISTFALIPIALRKFKAPKK